MSALAAIVSRDERVLARGPDALGRLVHQESWDSLAAASEALWAGACGPAESLSRADGAAGTSRAVFAGDLLNIVSLRRELGLTPGAAPADVALAAYVRWGTAFFDHLEGNYVLLLHDAPAGLTLAGVDPRGLGQLQAVRLGEDVLLASEAKAFFADPRFKAKLDSTGLADLMITGWVLDGGALFASVEGLALGCHFEMRAGKLASVRHADDRELVRGDLRGESYLDRMAVEIRAIAAEAFAGEELLLPVTGGLDVRLVLAAAPSEADPLAFTFGAPGDADVRGGRAVAHAHGLRHVIVEPEPDFLQAHAATTVRLTEGRLNVIDNTTGDRMRSFAGRRHFVSGSAGEAGRRSLRTCAMMPDGALLGCCDAEFETRFLNGVWKPPLACDRMVDIFGPEGAHLYDAGVERIAGKVRAGAGLAPADRLDLHLVDTSEGNTRLRLYLASQWVPARAPFLTRRWVEALFSGVPEERIDDLTRLRLIRRLDRAVARVPWALTHLSLPLSEPLVRAARAGSWLVPLKDDVARRCGVDAAAPHGRRSGAGGTARPGFARRVKRLIYSGSTDTERWLRGPSRPYVESVLLSDRLAERGPMDRDAVKRFWREQLAGAEHGRALGLLLTTELWCREFLDGEPG